MTLRNPSILLLALVLAAGCPDNTKPLDDTMGNQAIDADGDGFDSDEDCDDSDPTVHPGADEICDEIDNDCDGEVDEDTDETFWGDVDGDGYGDPDVTINACEAPSGYVENADDCDDDDDAQHPGADELCNNEDDDCDGEIDEDDAIDAPTWYLDSDGDGYGDQATTMVTCDQPTGYVLDGSDCDDADALQYPGADELCNGEDDDCDGEIDEDEALDTSTWYADADGDGYGDAATTVETCEPPEGYVRNNTDCDDTDPLQYPGADEYCNGEDDDCDLDVDEDDAVDVMTWYRDADTDGYGDPATSDIDCDQPKGFVRDSTDCDDRDPAQHPGADEYCNGEDDDCDGAIDEDDAIDVSTWYADSDGDTYGDPLATDIDCDQPSGYVADDTDCDDTDAAQYPGADEYCNGEDDDCDGDVDEDDAVDVSTWYADTDGDTYGDPAASDIDCNRPSGYVPDNTDCDDTDAAQYPGADEYCNGEDDDCDGDIDEDDALDVATWYADTDADSYGDPASSDIDCDQPTGYVADGTDCDDTDPAQYPGADEYCNGEDDDCDGSIDEDDAVDVSTWYADADLDSYGDAASADIDCDQPTGYVADDTDCDDADPAQYPGADEYCNGEDDDCDGDVDEDGEVLDGDIFYADSDGDSFGDPDDTIAACSQPSGYEDNALDCDDTDATEPVVVDASSGSSSGAGTISSPLDAVQDGVDNATQCVVVFAGTYYESVVTNGTDLEITGVEGSDLTIIDATGTGGAAFEVAGGETAATVITGFTLMGDGHLDITSSSYACTSIITCTDYYYTYCGGGLYVSSSDPTFEDIVAEGSSLPVASTVISYPDTTYTISYGGGMCFLDSASMVSGSTVASNYADQGGGVYADETSAVSFGQSYIIANEATDGGGLELDGGSVSYTNVASSFNEASSQGGGLFLIDGSGVATNVTIAGDDAVTGGGVYVSGTSSLAMMNSIVYGATTGVGVLVDGGASFTGSYNDVYANLAGNYSGITDPTGTDGNQSVAPMFVAYSDDGVLSNDDLHLNSYSALIDAGDPSTTYDDADGSTNDVGAYGGPQSDWD
jgi:hypothetical protein